MKALQEAVVKAEYFDEDWVSPLLVHPIKQSLVQPQYVTFETNHSIAAAASVRAIHRLAALAISRPELAKGGSVVFTRPLIGIQREADLSDNNASLKEYIYGRPVLFFGRYFDNPAYDTRRLQCSNNSFVLGDVVRLLPISFDGDDTSHRDLLFLPTLQLS
jgi:hypothetical protein